MSVRSTPIWTRSSSTPPSSSPSGAAAAARPRRGDDARPRFRARQRSAVGFGRRPCDRGEIAPLRYDGFTLLIAAQLPDQGEHTEAEMSTRTPHGLGMLRGTGAAAGPGPNDATSGSSSRRAAAAGAWSAGADVAGARPPSPGPRPWCPLRLLPPRAPRRHSGGGARQPKHRCRPYRSIGAFASASAISKTSTSLVPVAPTRADPPAERNSPSNRTHAAARQRRPIDRGADAMTEAPQPQDWAKLTADLERLLKAALLRLRDETLREARGDGGHPAHPPAAIDSHLRSGRRRRRRGSAGP